MSQAQDLQRWIDEVMPKVIGALGVDVGKARYEVREVDDTFIMSCMYRARVRFASEADGRKEELSIILKRPLGIFSQKVCLEIQFHNEILFYRTYVRPDDESYARCHYVEERPPNDSVIALENVNERGYYSCPQLYNPPLEYTLAAMRELGRLHGRGYAMKELQREKFFDIVARIREVRFVRRPDNHYEFYCNVVPLRAVEYLRGQGYDASFCDRMEAFFSDSFDRVMMRTIQPLEPLATLCHGDFTLSNILFKTEADGRYRPMLIDFALLTYSTPVVDLATYLYCNCSNEVRRERFPEIMRAYHDALREYLLDVGVQDVERYSYSALLNDFKRGAAYGFVIMCSFVPMLLGPFSPEVHVRETLDLGSLESAKRHKRIGGDETSKILADALLSLKDLGSLDHVS